MKILKEAERLRKERDDELVKNTARSAVNDYLHALSSGQAWIDKMYTWSNMTPRTTSHQRSRITKVIKMILHMEHDVPLESMDVRTTEGWGFDHRTYVDITVNAH